MLIQHAAVAGTLESCDTMVLIEPSSHIEIQVESTVQEIYGNAIRAQVERTLSQLQITGAKLTIRDRGAFDYVIAARVETAVLRAGREEVSQ